MNVIWFILVAVSILLAVLTGNADKFTASIFDAAKAAVEVALYLAGIISLWLGITKIIEDSGLIHRLSKAFRPVVTKLFRDLPPDHPAITPMTLNFLANVFGLGNAATPMGIKAMQELQTLNKEQDTITFEMMLFVLINTASIQLIPFTVIGILSSYGSQMPAAIVLPTLIATAVTTSFAVTLLFVFRRFHK